MYLTFFHCPIVVKCAVSDVNLLKSIGWTGFGYTSVLFYLMKEAEPAIEALYVCLTKTKRWKKIDIHLFQFDEHHCHIP
jgi:hypothetical protein